MSRKEYNKARTDIYNLSLYVAEIEKMDKDFPLLKQEALRIIKEKSEEIEKELEEIMKGEKSE
jgi:hypothetical protein